MTVHLSRILNKNEKWVVSAGCQRLFKGIKKSLIRSPFLAIADQNRPFHVVCDASYFSIVCSMMQYDADGTERAVCNQSRQLQPAKRIYSFRDKELLDIKYALAKFIVSQLGGRPFIFFTDHASLYTAVNTPQLLHRM